MRKPHKLVASTKLSFPTNLIFTDTETTTLADNETEHKPQLIVGVTEYIKLTPDLNIEEKRKIIYRTVDEYWAFIDDMIYESNSLTMFAHNWSFDFPVLNGLDYMHRLGFTLKQFVDAGPPIILKYKRGKQSITVLDSLNYYRDSLANIGKSLGINKIDCDTTMATIDELIPYCERDVEILREAILSLYRFLYKNDLCKANDTLSSIALNTFVRRFKNRDIYIDANDKRTDIARKSYFGGRTEAFRIGKYEGPFYLIDVNSQYPFCMKNNKFPFKTERLINNVNIKHLDKLVYHETMTIKCRIKTDIPAYPVKINKRTCFPIGEFTTYLSTPEIEYAYENGHIKSIDQLVLYYADYIFSDYVDYFYSLRNRLRSNCHEAQATQAKLLLNSLYGKFGQNLNKWEKVNIEPIGKARRWLEFNMDTGKRVFYMELNGEVFEALHQTESMNSYPAIAAHVTAYGRMIIQRMIDYLGKDNVFYCDTDSVLINQIAYEKVKDKLDPKILGCWSLDGTYDQITIYGAKDYEFGDKTRIKGIKQKAVKIRKGVYEQLQFSSLKRSIELNELGNPRITRVTKNLRRDYRKGRIDSCGHVLPFELPDNGLEIG